MQITLGRSQLAVSRIALGTWQLSGQFGGFDNDEAIAAIRHARELGVNLFDTAHAYGWGRAEQILGQALREELRARRESVVIVTKGGLRVSESGRPFPDADRGFLRMGIENSLRSLGVDYIDVYLIHKPDPATPFADTAEFLQQYVANGTIRHVGVSNANAVQTAEFSAAMPVDVIEPPYHLLRRDIETELLPYAASAGLGVLTYSPLATGLLSGALRAESTFAPDDWRGYAPAFQGDQLRHAVSIADRLAALAREQFGVSVATLATAWALANPAVHSVIVGTHRGKHIRQAVDATRLDLGPDALAGIDGVFSTNVTS